MFKAIESRECDAGCAGPYERSLGVVEGRRGENWVAEERRRR